MKQNTFNVKITEFRTTDDLPEKDKELVEAAFTAAANAYAPYSGFTVGAALRLKSNMIVTGNNQENAAYPSGLCAERVAMFYASSQYPGQSVETIAVVAPKAVAGLDEPVTPCGSCRQVMAEYEQLQKKPLRVIMTSGKGKCFLVEGMDNLLPLAFQARHLRK